jgi:hypothetical protein
MLLSVSPISRWRWCVYMYVCMPVHMYTRKYVSIDLRKYMPVSMFVCMYLFITFNASLRVSYLEVKASLCVKCLTLKLGVVCTVCILTSYLKVGESGHTIMHLLITLTCMCMRMRMCMCMCRCRCVKIMYACWWAEDVYICMNTRIHAYTHTYLTAYDTLEVPSQTHIEGWMLVVLG